MASMEYTGGGSGGGGHHSHKSFKYVPVSLSDDLWIDCWRTSMDVWGVDYRGLDADLSGTDANTEN